MEPIVPQPDSPIPDPPAALSPVGDPVAEAGEVAPRPTGVWSAIIGAILMYVGGMLVGGLLAVLVLALLVSPWGPPPPHGPPSPSFTQAMAQPRFLVLSLTLVYAFTALSALLAGRNTGLPWRQRLGLVRGRVPTREFPLLVLGSLGALGLGLVVASMLHRAGLLPELGKWRGFALGRALASAKPVTRVALVLAGSVLAGLAEELVFRGYLQRALLTRWRPGLAIGVSSVVFAVLHGDPGYDVFALPIGVFLGYMAWRADSIVPTIVCHMTVNGIAQCDLALYGHHPAWLVRLVTGVPPGAHADPRQLALTVWGALVASAALAWIGIWRVQRCTRIAST
jgi:uncharacterized protein